MGNFLQDVNRFKKMMKVVDDLGNSESWWTGNPMGISEFASRMGYKRYSQINNIYNQAVKEGYIEEAYEPYNTSSGIVEECLSKNPAAGEHCIEQANELLRVPSGEEMQADPIMYVDHPYKYIREGARKLLTGED